LFDWKRTVSLKAKYIGYWNPGSNFRMSDEMMETYIRQTIENTLQTNGVLIEDER